MPRQSAETHAASKRRALEAMRQKPYRQHGASPYWHPIDGDPTMPTVHHSTLIQLWSEGRLESTAERRRWKTGEITARECEHFFAPGLDLNPRCTGCTKRLQEVAS